MKNIFETDPESHYRFSWNFKVSVNVSWRQFAQEKFVQDVCDILEEEYFPASNLILELTEHCQALDEQILKWHIAEFHKYGVGISADDFGSGYSSLNMLKDIKMDTIKLDMGFLRKTRNNERSMSIVSNVIHLSKRLGMEVVTEGVETREQVDALTMMGCDVFQGYYFAKPMSVWDYEDKYISTEG